MDKIIDGVDVSECPLFEKKTGCYHTFNGECVKDSCAVYKWLLEHKCMKAKYDNSQVSHSILKTAYLELQEENERLEKELKDYKTSKENSYQNLQKEWQQLQWDIRKLTTENERLKARLRPLEDSYFKGLSSIEIAELAKKSIRITAENRKLEQALQEIKRIIIQEKVTNNKKLRAILDLITKAEEGNE